MNDVLLITCITAWEVNVVVVIMIIIIIIIINNDNNSNNNNTNNNLNKYLRMKCTDAILNKMLCSGGSKVQLFYLIA